MPLPQLVLENHPAGYRRLLLARPERHNALDVAFTRALRDAFAADPAAVVVLGSTDPRVFCAGADLALADADRARVSDLLYQCYEVMVARPGPVIAAVGGPAVGGGAQLAAAADLRIAAPAARFRWTGPPGRGLAVGAWILPDLVGRGAAMDLAMTGRWVGAAEASALGMVNRVEGDPLAAAEALAAELAARGTGSAARVKLVTSAGGLLERLHAEHRANSAAWDEAIAAANPRRPL
jgi:enoyl-CoA hydratase/carnithine racemase